MKLPIFEFLIDDSKQSGVKAISIVDDPAFQSSLIAFDKAKPQFVQFIDTKGKKKKQICIGLSLIPNVLIYREDDTFGSYYGFFSAETIEKIVEKYHEEMNTNKVNIGHNSDQYIDAFLVSDYIVDSEEKVQDLKRMGIEHENIMGSWVTAFKIKNEQVFNQIINGSNKTGFSIECYLNRHLVQMHIQINDKKIKQEMKKNNKTLLDKIIDIFKKEILERSLVPELGFEIEWTEVGQPVQQVTVDAEGKETFTPLGVGEYKTEVGIVVVDDASNLAEVRELPIEPEIPEEIEIPELKLPAEDLPIEEPTGKTESPAEMKSEDKLKDYPWDECIADQKAKGYSEERANKICGYIRSKNMSSDELTEDMIKEALGDDYVSPTAQLDKTILEIVGTNDGEYMIKVKVEGGLVTKAEVSNETDLLMAKLSKFEEENKVLETENKELKDKMKEPINEPILEPPVEKKEWSKMTAYEKTLYRARQDK
jgi:hypothetical protein